MVKFTVEKIRESRISIKRRLTQIKETAFRQHYVSRIHAVQESAMFRLASLLYSLISTSLAGTMVIGVLVAGFDTLMPILIAAAVGFALAAPVSWLVARRIYN